MLDKINYNDNLPIKVQLLRIENYPIHWHNDIQILYVLEGEINLRLTYTNYHLIKNDIHLIHTGDVHGLTNISEKNLILIFNINVEYFSKIFPNLENQIFTIKVENNSLGQTKKEDIKTLLFSVTKELIFKDTDYKKKTLDLSIELIKVLYSEFRGFTISREERIFSLKVTHDIFQMERINRIISYVYENYFYKLSFTDIAKKENINSYYLSHLFQHFVGESFRSFVSMVRVEMSEIKLLSTNLSISQIAQDVGFSNPKYFVDNFRLWFGYHPKEYRKLFSNKTLNKVKPCIKELPLDTIIENFSHSVPCEIEEPIISPITIPIEFDLKDIPLGKFELFKNNKIIQKTILPISLINKNCHILFSDVSKLYYNISPNKSCINLLKKIIYNPKELKEDICLIDSTDSVNGLFTINGLKKPLYYLYTFLSKMASELIEIGDNYIISKDIDKYSIIVFNEDEISSAIIDIKIFNLSHSYKLTKSKITSANSCIDYWCQLNFNTNISDEDFEIIEAMSQPRISFEIIPKNHTYGLSLDLEPESIVFMEFNKILN
ncbi:helix-turn-helix domain-containing protein [Anaerovorax odorimutans]|uniref:helix-turn-helix domain-containing protein n=1 Tax=Anaerovorax odorimutans TaxID=109327 RepID=UPI0003FDAFE6|nr:helix-turn-helix domain-containing protein [Anaerovorax odorimutans]